MYLFWNNVLKRLENDKRYNLGIKWFLVLYLDFYLYLYVYNEICIIVFVLKLNIFSFFMFVIWMNSKYFLI